MSKPIQISSRKSSSPMQMNAYSQSPPSLSLSSSFNDNLDGLEKSKMMLENLNIENKELSEKIKRLLRRVENQISDTEILKEEFECISKEFSKLSIKRRDIATSIKHFESLSSTYDNVKICSLSGEFFYAHIDSLKNFQEISELVKTYFNIEKIVNFVICNGIKYHLQTSEKFKDFMENVRKYGVFYFVYE